MSRYFVEFNVAVNIICNIMMAPGCDREINAHFYSGLTVLYQIPDTLPDITHSHIILTLFFGQT